MIVRALNEERTIGHSLAVLTRQTVRPQIIVVDSGSTDASVRIAASYCDELIRLPPELFSYGHALNVGAQAAAGSVHFALSAHCFPESDDWIERSLGLYEDTNVAGTGGMRFLPDGSPAHRTFHQRAVDARARPQWGFSNHASSWRADVWRQFPFDEELDATEDKEWAWRVLHHGWVIAFHPRLWVDMSHQWRTGLRASYRRQKREARGLRSFAPLPPYRPRDMWSEWWHCVPSERKRPAWVHRFLNVRRHAGLVGKYHGSRRSEPASPLRNIRG